MDNLVKGYCLEVEESEVFRMMGYPRGTSVSEPVRHICREQVRQVIELAHPWGSFLEIRIAVIEGDSVRLETGKTLRSRRLASILRRAESVTVCMVTLGVDVSAEIQRLMAGNCMIEAMALDAASSVATNALMGQLRELICGEARARSCGTTIQYGPGYTGWEIGDMRGLFSCLETEQPPVRLNEQLMMIPEKSLLGVLGIVPGGRQAAEVVPCRLCDLRGCSLRCEPYCGERNL